jgi:CheY-like chemotaxis protein
MQTLDDEFTHVMLADDDEDDYYVFSLAVAEVPVKILLTRAEDGNKLMRLLNEKLPDILFLDLRMPIKDGHECLREIRADKRFDKLPIVIYSSLEDLRNIEFCFREGANLYAVKPSTLAELKTSLERVLNVNWKKMQYFPTFSQFVIRA